MPYFGIPIRNGLPIGLGSVAGFGAFQFSPSALFAAGEQGAWYDPSDPTTLFQDAAGTTPTVMETRVRLMLDKSKGLVLGPELVTNGDFSSGTTGWTAAGLIGFSVVSGQAVVSRNSGAIGDFPSQNIGMVADRWYEVTVDVIARSNNVSVYLGTPSAANEALFTATGAGQKRLVLATGNSVFFGPTGLNVATCTIDNISIREIPGNHATAPSDASSPILRARYNLLTYSEDFSNAAWDTNGGSVTKTASTITATATTAQHFAGQSLGTLITGTLYRFCIELKYGNNQFVVLRGDRGTNPHLCVDVLNGQFGAVGASISSQTITQLADGWLRVQFDCLTTSSGNGSFLVILTNVNLASNPTWTATGTEFVNVRNVDARPSTDAALNIPAYQSITTATSYDTNGFPAYLAFDGTDDSFSTASIDFTGTDKMTVFAGVTKLSDAARGIVYELSADLAVNNGAFHLETPYINGAPGLRARSRGTATATAEYVGVASPQNFVFTNSLDISVPQNEVRIDALQQALSGSNQGTGNYGNYPLFIGRRNNASLTFNGRIYSLIIRGASTTTPLIASTEQWVAGKMRLPI